ncbi:carbohydrate ABC transporter permease [Ktedonosporobacter rubrisoli]|uniref:Carbohydrate ABC transporter permease n=1 Tax=Ktedonosporobacter rubrisoli TaxID=2509675 RepID=A0A4P6JP32_KTERU|nr:carbohydrate ABC transporter permease [Ktedonosporobacter rubrisoli]QBD76943.1 carbohydrate ABC transporter permease [Ktedonosporobacter rubrisoli]
MAILMQNPQDQPGQRPDSQRRWFSWRASDDDASERTLVPASALKRPLSRTLYWLVFALLLIATLTTLGPLYWMVSGALKSSVEIFQTPPTFWPQHPQWSNYINAWTFLNFPLYFWNTLALAAGAVVLQIVVSASAAYALAKLRPDGKNIIQFCFFCTLMVPPVVYLIPQFVNVSDLPIIHVSLVNSWSGVWLPEAANAFNILVLKSFFDTIPNELTEAACLDGANSWQIFTRIMLPLSRPALAVITIFTIIASWKDFLWPLLVLADDHLQPLMVMFYHQSRANSGLPFTYLIAGLVFTSLPPVVVFLIFQRQIIRGINLSGLKG